MTESEYKTTSSNSNLGWKIAIPVIIGIVVIYFLFRKDFNIETFKEIKFTANTWLGLVFVCCAFFAREFGMAWRFNTITSRQLTMGKSFYTTFLCEFTSAITPSSVGGSALSMIFMNREGINLGRATTFTLIILFLDNLFFTLFAPLVIFIGGSHSLFDFSQTNVETSLETIFWVAYSLMTFLTVFLGLGIFFIPNLIKKFIERLFSLRFLKKWRNKMTELGQNMVNASVEVKNMKLAWWLEAFTATCVSWIGRFLVVNAIFFAILPHSPQGVIFCRQIIVWALLMFTPTPGGSGVSEWLFDKYYFDLIPEQGVVMVLALLWRLFSYYVYLIIGIFLVPSFLRKKHA